MKLTEGCMKTFTVGKCFKENTGNITSMDFSNNAELLVSSSDDDSIVLYDCYYGTNKRTLNSKKYGVSNICFTHNANAVIHSSTKVDDTIRYLSVHDNKYIRYFQGHTARVVSVSMSPNDDCFLSGSLDKTLRLWDLRSPNCHGLMHLPSRPVAAFDPDGLLFAAGVNSEQVKLYDLRSFDRGPFTTFKLPPPPDRHLVEWTNLKFSPDGHQILVSTNSSQMHLIDAFDGKLFHSLSGYANPKNLALEASFSPDSQLVLSGSADGRLHVWNAQSGTKVAVLVGEHTGPVTCVRFNPKNMMFASACTRMCFWIPSADE